MENDLKTAEKVVEPEEEETIRGCGCDDETEEPHPCPYNDELGLTAPDCRCCIDCQRYCWEET